MPNRRGWLSAVLRTFGGCCAAFGLFAFAAACADATVPTSNGDPDSGTDGDTDSDTDVDSDTDSDAECTLETSETFDGDTLPSGWEIENFDEDAYGYAWDWSEDDNSTGGTGGYWWINGAFPVAFDDRLISETYTRGACPEVVLSFNQDFAREGSTDFGYVQIQVDEGTWQTLTTISASTTGGFDTDLSSFLPSASSEFRIRFRYVGNNNLHWKVDDFELFGGNP